MSIPLQGLGRFCRQIVIDNYGGVALTDYQTEILLNHRPDIGVNLIGAKHMRADGADIRFWDATGAPIPHCIRPGTVLYTASPSLFVKPPALQAGPRIIWMTYGSARNLPNANSYDQTFTMDAAASIPGVIDYWKFPNGAGATASATLNTPALDGTLSDGVGGTGPDWTASGPGWRGTGPVFTGEKSLSFVKANTDRVVVPNNVLLNPATEMSWAVWVKDPATGAFDSIICRWPAASAQYLIRFNVANLLEGYLRNTASTLYVVVGPDASCRDNAWHLLGSTGKIPGNLQLWKDAAVHGAATVMLGAGIMTNAEPLVFGAVWQDPNYFSPLQGSMDSPMFFSSELTAAQQLCLFEFRKYAATPPRVVVGREFVLGEPAPYCLPVFQGAL